MFNEKQIVVLSGISGVLHLAACILLAIVWTYWSDTLNSCPETNCSCIFYGHLRGTSFIGGSPIWCSIITYYTLIAAIVSIGIAVYFFARIRNKPKDFPNRAIDSDGNIPRSRYLVEYHTLQLKLVIKYFKCNPHLLKYHNSAI